jgi:fused signal recognition particle receptor
MEQSTPAETDADRASLEAGLDKTRHGLVRRIHDSFRGGSDDDAWEQVEEALIAGDVGARLAMEVVGRARAAKDAQPPEAAVQRELAALFATREPVPWPRKPAPDVPAVILVVGVNGTGKTTTIAKLAARFSRRGARVLIAAADTFRAAAIEQLETWATRVDVPIVSGRPDGDPAAVVFDAVNAATARGNSTVIADTAGRLHTKGHLMDELGKIVRVAGRARAGAPDEVLLVLDGTAGQNAIQQARQFTKDAKVTGVVITKLDGTAKGGAVFAIVHELGLPVKFLGVGEKADDLVPMDPRAFVEALLPRAA